MKTNTILLTDSYKPSHSPVYPKGMTYMQSYFESRSEKSRTLMYGLQGLLMEHLEGQRIKVQDVKQAKTFFNAHFGRNDVFDYKMWMRIATVHHGRIPIRIWAVPEGCILPTRTPLIVVESTDPEIPHVVNYFEGLLSHVWYPITVASYSYEIKQIIEKYIDITCVGDEATKQGILNFRLHDFGFRGVSSVETAGIGASAHLVNFLGTDTLVGIMYAMTYYNAEMCGFSIPATEHSTMTIKGVDGECGQIERMLDTYPTGLVAIVSDSYNIKNAIENYMGKTLYDKIMSRDGTLVVRPDSGDPRRSTLEIFELLWKTFGGTTNKNGYRVLDSHVRMIQGDGINKQTVDDILYNFMLHGIAAENIAFGSGGALLQKHDRDEYKFAFKCCMAIIDGKEVNVFKSPMEYNADGVYEKSFKHSKTGNLLKIKGNKLVKVFENGELFNKTTFDEIKSRVTI